LIKITNTTFTGKEVHSFKTIDSTNNFAKVLINQKTVKNGTLVHSEFQTSGKGQKGNVWIGNAGENIYVSFIFHFDSLSTTDFFSLNQLSSLSIIQTLESFTDHSPKIKWPNDIYIDHHKVAGVLIENIISDSLIKTSIIGIGINVNQTEFSDYLSASSLKLLNQKEFEINKIIDNLALHLEKNYLLLLSDESALNIDYHTSLYNLEKTQKFLLNDVPKEAIIKGVDKFGRLKLESDNEIRGYDHHEVTWRL